MKRAICWFMVIFLTVGLSLWIRQPVRAEKQKLWETDWSRSQQAQTSGWQVIKTETFEGVFPTTGWSVVDLSNDGYDRKWDDDNYRPHAGLWAAWPARGGTHGRDPVAGNDDYFNNMETRMVYGPFDLGDAAQAEVSFWLWMQIEVNSDYLLLEASGNGANFQELARYSGSAGWQQKTISLDAYKGDNSVWVAWRFYSNNSIVFDGPWVDDILIRKYQAGQVTAQGTLYYYNRSNAQLRARYTKVKLYESDPRQAGDLLATTHTDAVGFFSFPPMTNWDTDVTDPDPNNRRLDLYVVAEAVYSDSGAATRRVADLAGQTYEWSSITTSNVPDGIVDISLNIAFGSSTIEAMWIFQDLRSAWEYIHNSTSPQIDPGSVTALWQIDVDTLLPCNGSCFYGGPGVPYIFIADSNRLSADTVVHEASHHYMFNATGWWLWWDIGCYSHNLFTEESESCAWSEGWADFYPLPANGDTCFDYGIGPCGAGGGVYENLESRNRNDYPPSFPWGDIVEGRVAGALYDLFDSTNEGYDSAAFSLDPITDIVFQGTSETTFNEFWNNWKASGQNKHHSVRAFYQNTIDYDTAPSFDQPLQDRSVLQGFSYAHVIDLWMNTADGESADTELTYQITNITDTRCGVSLDNHWINISPQPSWLGFCDATIRVSDSMKTADDTFRVSVISVHDRIYFSLIRK